MLPNVKKLPPFRGNLAKDEPRIPYYTMSYGNIITGDGYLPYRESIFISEIFNRPLAVKYQSKKKPL